MDDTSGGDPREVLDRPLIPVFSPLKTGHLLVHTRCGFQSSYLEESRTSGTIVERGGRKTNDVK